MPTTILDLDSDTLYQVMCAAAGVRQRKAKTPALHGWTHPNDQGARLHYYSDRTDTVFGRLSATCHALNQHMNSTEFIRPWLEKLRPWTDYALDSGDADLGDVRGYYVFKQRLQKAHDTEDAPFFINGRSDLYQCYTFEQMLDMCSWRPTILQKAIAPLQRLLLAPDGPPHPTDETLKAQIRELCIAAGKVDPRVIHFHVVPMFAWRTWDLLLAVLREHLANDGLNARMLARNVFLLGEYAGASMIEDEDVVMEFLRADLGCLSYLKQYAPNLDTDTVLEMISDETGADAVLRFIINDNVFERISTERYALRLIDTVSRSKLRDFPMSHGLWSREPVVLALMRRWDREDRAERDGGAAPSSLYGSPLENCPLRSRASFAAKVVAINGDFLRYFTHRRAVTDVVIRAAVTENGLALRYLGPWAGDRITARAALAAVSQNGEAIKYLPEHLREDDEVAIAALENTLKAIPWVQPHHRTDERIRAGILSGACDLCHASVTQCADKRIVSCVDFRTASEADFKLVAWDLRRNGEFWKDMYDKNKVTFELLSLEYELQTYRPLVMEALRRNGHNLRHLAFSAGNSSAEYICQALQSDPTAIKHVSSYELSRAGRLWLRDWEQKLENMVDGGMGA